MGVARSPVKEATGEGGHSVQLFFVWGGVGERRHRPRDPLVVGWTRFETYIQDWSRLYFFISSSQETRHKPRRHTLRCTSPRARSLNIDKLKHPTSGHQSTKSWRQKKPKCAHLRGSFVFLHNLPITRLSIWWPLVIWKVYGNGKCCA